MLMICNTKLTKFSNRTTVKRSLLAVILVLLVSCDNFSQMERIKVSSFGTLNDGRDVQLFTLENARGTYVEIINLGGIIVSLHTADDSGNMTDITTGFDNQSNIFLVADTWVLS